MKTRTRVYIGTLALGLMWGCKVTELRECTLELSRDGPGGVLVCDGGTRMIPVGEVPAWLRKCAEQRP